MKRAIVIFIFVLISCWYYRAEQLPIRTYTTADGLPRDRVYKIVPDPRGFSGFVLTTVCRVLMLMIHVRHSRLGRAIDSHA